MIEKINHSRNEPSLEGIQVLVNIVMNEEDPLNLNPEKQDFSKLA
jgi:hypothetical protein